MSAQQKAIARQLFEGWSRHDPNAAVQKLAANFSNHNPPPGVDPNVAGLKQWVRSSIDAFPDIAFTIEDQMVEGDRVMTRWTARGTHKGTFMGKAPTGKSVTVTGITIARIRDDEVVESWGEWDTLGLMRQIGLVPAAGQAAAPA